MFKNRHRHRRRRPWPYNRDDDDDDDNRYRGFPSLQLVTLRRGFLSAPFPPSVDLIPRSGSSSLLLFTTVFPSPSLFPLPRGVCCVRVCVYVFSCESFLSCDCGEPLRVVVVAASFFFGSSSLLKSNFNSPEISTVIEISARFRRCTDRC